jgi:hypothetical protein
LLPAVAERPTKKDHRTPLSVNTGSHSGVREPQISSAYSLAAFRVHQIDTLPVHLSKTNCNNKRNDNQEEEQQACLPITTKKIGTPTENSVLQSHILSFPEVSLKRQDSGAALGQYRQCLRVLGAESAIEPVL